MLRQLAIAALRRLCRPSDAQDTVLSLPPGAAVCYGETQRNGNAIRHECRGCLRWQGRHERGRQVLTNLGSLRLYDYCPDRLRA